jgi:signal transduction histidine kinase
MAQPVTVGRAYTWAKASPKTVLGLMLAGAFIIIVFGNGGLVSLYMETAGVLQIPAVVPPLWATLLVAAAFAATSVAFVLWHWRQPMGFFFAATGFQVVWTLALQIREPILGIGAWTFLWFALFFIVQRLSTLTAWICLFTNLAVFACLFAGLRERDWGDAWQLLLILGIGLNVAAGSFVIMRGTRRRYIDALLERNRLLRIQRDQRAELAVAAERNRIAREMHDIVSHSLAVMVTLSDGAARLIDREPAAAAEAMGEIAKTGRRAVGDMRRLIEFLRSEADLRPQPSITDLGDLVASYQQSGLPVKVELATAPPDDPALGLTIYRIVQEALTNVLRHAPASPEVTVRIAQSAPGVIDVIVDNAPGESPLEGAGSGSGQGLVGMRQRTEVWHGQLEAGPTADGGWRVHATLPVAED